MLRNYIEKNIFRQVYISEQLFLNKRIDLHRMSEQLNVCLATIHNDLKVLEKTFIKETKWFNQSGDICSVSFISEYSLLELTQLLYRNSNFLIVLNYFLNGESNCKKIAEKEFISTSKIYQIRLEIFHFAEEWGYLAADQSFSPPEKQLRYLLISISLYTGIHSSIPYNKIIASDAAKLVDYIEANLFSRDYPERERELIILGIQLSNQRARKFSIHFTEDERMVAKQTPLFILIQKGLNNLSSTICTNEDELFFIYSLFNARNYLCNNLELLKKDFNVVNINYIKRYPIAEELFQQICRSLDISKDNELLQKNVFIPFFRSTWADLQLFQPDLLYLLDNDQKNSYQKIEYVLYKWSVENNVKIHWNNNLIAKLAINLDYLCKNDFDQKIEIYIIAPSDFKFLYYRKTLNKLSKRHFNISDMIYKDLETVTNDNFFFSKRIIICDTILYNETSSSKNTFIFPVTLQNIDEICLNINRMIDSF